MNELERYPSLRAFGEQLDEQADRDATRARRPRRLAVALSAVTVLLGAAYVAPPTRAAVESLYEGTVASWFSAPPEEVSPNLPAAPVTGPLNAGAAHQTSSAALRETIDHGEAYLTGTDWGSARSFAIPGTALRGWTFEQPNRRCLALPSFSVGYGVVCRTPEQIAHGQGTLTVKPASGASQPDIVGVMVVPNGRAVISKDPDATARFARIAGLDLYAGSAPSGSRAVARR